MERTLGGLRDDEVVLAARESRPKSAASWGAIVAGALVAAGVSLILFALGSGLGFASLSPWPGQGAGLEAFSIGAVIWLIVMQWVSSLLGGYIAGRLRTRWIGTHEHEIFFRDTAHGLVTWALATLIVAALAASSVVAGVGGTVRSASSMLGQALGGVSAGTAVGTSAAAGNSSEWFDYGVDKMFRAGDAPRVGEGAASSAASADAGNAASGNTMSAARSDATSSSLGAAGSAPAPNAAPADSGPAGRGEGGPPGARPEIARIVMNSLPNGVSAADRSYLVSLVAARTGTSAAEAQQRVDAFIASVQRAEDQLRADADAARKTAAEASLYTALALLIGAFIASVSAALGGRLRDEHI